MELKIENLEVTLQKNKILNRVSLTVKSGELISLLGASGCGKSTMLKSIAGLLDIEKGNSEYGAGETGNCDRVSGFKTVPTYDSGKEHSISNGT